MGVVREDAVHLAVIEILEPGEPVGPFEFPYGLQLAKLGVALAVGAGLGEGEHMIAGRQVGTLRSWGHDAAWAQTCGTGFAFLVICASRLPGIGRSG